MDASLRVTTALAVVLLCNILCITGQSTNYPVAGYLKIKGETTSAFVAPLPNVVIAGLANLTNVPRASVSITKTVADTPLAGGIPQLRVEFRINNVATPEQNLQICKALYQSNDSRNKLSTLFGSIWSTVPNATGPYYATLTEVMYYAPIGLQFPPRTVLPGNKTAEQVYPISGSIVLIDMTPALFTPDLQTAFLYSFTMLAGRVLPVSQVKILGMATTTVNARRRLLQTPTTSVMRVEYAIEGPFYEQKDAQFIHAVLNNTVSSVPRWRTFMNNWNYNSSVIKVHQMTVNAFNPAHVSVVHKPDLLADTRIGTGIGFGIGFPLTVILTLYWASWAYRRSQGKSAHGH